MTIKISEINVKDLGPITTLSKKLKQINLVYGKNEKGKTFLVEFIIRSVFKNPKNWILRNLQGKGRVTISGLSNDLQDFQPESPKKLEDFWEESTKGFPKDFSKLMVVRAADVKLAIEQNGIDNSLLKECLSSKGIVDEILEGIKPTLQNAKYEDGEIKGKRAGEIKSYQDTLKLFYELSEQIELISNKFSECDIASNKNILDEKLDLQNKLVKARNNYAFQKNEEIHEIDQELDNYPESILNDLNKAINNWDQLDEFKKKEEVELNEAKEKGKHFLWLKTAKEIFESRKLGELPKNIVLFIWISCFLLLSSFVSFFYYQRLEIALPTFVLSILSIGYYIIKISKLLKRKNDIEEIEGIKNGFVERFDQSLNGIVDINQKIEEVQPYRFQSDLLSKNIDKKKKELSSLSIEIKNFIRTFHNTDYTFDQCKSILENAREGKNELENKKKSLQIELANLKVNSKDFLAKKSTIKWDSEKLELTENEIDELNSLIQTQEQGLNDLKQSSCDLVDLKISNDWEEIILKLNEKKIQLEDELNILKARCIAKIIITEIAYELKLSEEQKIEEGFKASQISEYVQKITEKYEDIIYRDGIIFLKDRFEEYRLKDLSTGAYEQVLLAIRISFAQNLASDEPMFLILDDAFQFSDWDRRPRLVKLIFELAKDGWQIIYFTMDDHIRDLFKQEAKHLPKSNFAFIEI